MNCPKCGYERQARDNAFVPPGECPACGVVYSKHETVDESAETVQPMPAPNLRPSPVDALSLRKARERVEKRLREQQGKRVQDDRHARTLELAKQLASEELRKRQEEWKQARAEGEKSAAAEADAESPAPVSEAAPAPDDEPSSDHPPQNVESAADEMMKTADAIEETADAPPETVVEDPPEPVDDENAAEAAESRVKTESSPDHDVETVPLEASGEEDLPAAAFPSTAPEAEIPESNGDLPAAHVAAAALSRAPKSGSGTGLARLLPVVAWLILGAGIIGAVLSWTTITEVEAGARVPMAESMTGLPLGLLLGFAYLATGVLGFAFFWVSSLISTQLRDIQRMLMPEERDGNALQDETA
jgi:hypothetical protein